MYIAGYANGSCAPAWCRKRTLQPDLSPSLSPSLPLSLSLSLPLSLSLHLSPSLHLSISPPLSLSLSLSPNANWTLNSSWETRRNRNDQMRDEGSSRWPRSQKMGRWVPEMQGQDPGGNPSWATSRHPSQGADQAGRDVRGRRRGHVPNQ